MTESTEGEQAMNIIYLIANAIISPLSTYDRINLGMAVHTREGQNLYNWIKDQEQFKDILILFDKSGVLNDVTKEAMISAIYKDLT